MMLESRGVIDGAILAISCFLSGAGGDHLSDLHQQQVQRPAHVAIGKQEQATHHIHRGR